MAQSILGEREKNKSNQAILQKTSQHEFVHESDIYVISLKLTYNMLKGKHGRKENKKRKT